MQSFDPQVLKFIPPEQISKYLAKLHPGMVITEGTHESLVPGYIKDLEWNFYDESHRFYVHNTYSDMYKVMMGKYFSVNIVRWGNLPIFMQVANAKIDNNLFYQSMTVFGIICLHQVQRLVQKDEQVLIKINWYTASHWLFRWLHKPFNKRLLKLQKKQDYEDNIEIRQRRLDLRKSNFSFLTDDPNFINSNLLTNNVRFPKIGEPKKILLQEYSMGQIHRVECGVVELMLRRESQNEVELWPAICPHEGALLSQKHICDEVVVCPWHGRRFQKKLLNNYNQQEWRFLSIKVIYKEDYLEITEDIKTEEYSKFSCEILETV